MNDISSPFDSFKQKLDRFNQYGGTIDPAKAKPKPALSSVKEKLSYNEEERIKTILTRYRQFLNPVSREVEDDEASLMTAWNLFSKMQELNETSSSDSTYIENICITSPIAKKSEYTTGSRFAYLQAWFILNHEECAKLFIPELILSESRATLTFTPADIFKMPPFLKEILSAVQENA